MWDLIVSVSDHCLSFYFTEMSNLHHFFQNLYSFSAALYDYSYDVQRLSMVLCRHYCPNPMKVHYCFLPNLIVESGQKYQMVYVYLNL